MRNRPPAHREPPPAARWVRAFAPVVIALVPVLAGGSPATAALDISVPTTRNLGSQQVGGGTLSAALGSVQVQSTSINLWTATVSSTSCTTGGGGANRTVPTADISYWSGPVTSTLGLIAVATPGQLTQAQAVTLNAPRTAFTGLAVSVLLAGVTWNPTLRVTIPSNLVAGTYTCTVTHSVA